MSKFINPEIVYLSRCKVCRTPIRGYSAWFYRLRGIHPFNKNPQLCNQCASLKFPAVEQEVTVMFTDVRGFTSFSEQTSPAIVRKLLNSLYIAASKLLIQNDALVDKFIGDAIMAIFNAPIPQVEHRRVALETAFSLQENMADLKLPFAVGIGLNTGIAVTGNVGGGEVTDYTAIGDTVNVASRLSSSAGEGEILAGVKTCQGLGRFLPKRWTWKKANLQAKGKKLLVKAYRIYRH